MKLHSIDTGLFKLDGGAMFGVVPKSVWSRVNEPDSSNLCTWAMRCMLIEEGDQLMLIDTGLGDKQSDKFFSYFQPHGDDSLEKSLKAKGFSPNDITDVFLTHLHFDHCGGAVQRKGEDLIPTFRNAKYWSNETHWNWAIDPNPREKASFLKENFQPIAESGQLNFLKEGDSPLQGMKVECFNGHTEKQMIPTLDYKSKKIMFMADLMPSVGHLPLAWVMAYDIRPLVTLKERESILERAVSEGHVLFFEHDKNNECCTLKRTERGIRVDEIFKLSEI